MNNTLEEALVIAIADAFFRQKQYYSPSGASFTYGGECVNLVQEWLKKPDFIEKVGKEINNMIFNKREQVVEIAFELFTNKAKQVGEEAIRNFFNTSTYNDYDHQIRSRAREIAEKYLKDNAGIEALVKEKVDGLIADKSITIQVNITVTEKK